MLKPSYTQIMKKLNDEGQSKLTSRYSIVIAASKRARNIIDIVNEQTSIAKEADKTGEKMVDPSKLKEATRLNELLKNQKPISIAVDEIYAGKIRMKEFEAEDEIEEEKEFVEMDQSEEEV